jgi:hypothetical protein
MFISQSRSQHHKNGIRISKALFDEITKWAEHRNNIAQQFSKTTNKRKVFYIGGMTASVYAFVRKADEADWAEEMLKAGEINDLNDFKPI